MDLDLIFHNAPHYMYDKPDSQYSKLVMATRKAETETPGSGASEVRAKSAVVEWKHNQKQPVLSLYMRQLHNRLCTSYLLLPIRMQAIMDKMVQDITMGMGNFLKQKPKGQRKAKKICFVGDGEVLDMGGGNAWHLNKAIISPSNWSIEI